MKKRFMALFLSLLFLLGTVAEVYAAEGFSPRENLNYNLTALDESIVSTAANGRPKVLIFFSSGCYNCKYMLGLFKNTTKPLDDVDVIAAELNYGAEKERTEAFYNQYGTDKVTYCYGAAAAGWAYLDAVQPDSYKFTTPLVVYINRNNQIVQYTTGMDRDILNHIETYLPASSPEEGDGGDSSEEKPDPGTDTGSDENPPEKEPEHEHQYETIVNQATLSKNGSVEKKCTECGFVADTKVIYYPKTIKLAKTEYTYNGKICKPSVAVTDSMGNEIDGNSYSVAYSKNKNVGTATAVIKFKGNYSGTVKKTFTIRHKNTSISRLSAKSKGISLKWKKQTSQVTGYQIQYSTSSKFTKGKTSIVTVNKNKTTSKAISRLKAKKKYYVRIRTYKNVKINGKTLKIYSNWSKTKTVVTKR